MEKPEDAVTPERATSEETRAGTESKPTAAGPKTSWIEVLVDPRTLLHEMRLHKDSDELAILRKAAEVTSEANPGASDLARRPVET